MIVITFLLQLNTYRSLSPCEISVHIFLHGNISTDIIRSGVLMMFYIALRKVTDILNDMMLEDLCYCLTYKFIRQNIA